MAIDRYLKLLWKMDIEKINAHLPKATKSLAKLLMEEEPSVITRDGSRIYFEKDELKKLVEIIPTEFHKKITLPFILIRRLDFGKGIFTIGGGPLQAFTIKKILGITEKPFQNYAFEEKNETNLYWHHIRDLRKKFKSSFVIGFAANLPKEFESVNREGPSWKKRSF